jgi:hypothetical protein
MLDARVTTEMSSADALNSIAVTASAIKIGASGTNP